MREIARQPSSWRIQSLEIEITPGLTGITLPQHNIPGYKKARLLRLEGKPCGVTTGIAVFPSVTYRGHRDYGRHPYVVCDNSICGQEWR